ncbi:alpha-ribazole phosphatase/probable phosphoglycerate mutase [Natranaerovirga pectinivora]|uniref:Alpha-ribazole phosphatase/probable phosphoglycerate mutase n=1 Tax=Natranaerovirga pectinivora TaxID=682400 RepID=A0A4R3MLJ5_9FIRM|nr:histidine phosphatase family protein [Natranaerovirga pectinivora]TCT15518.1 alpha-ribazole phosphatase/probable phosphoglycerate mutase [Natranaerovirga pectinivora]
MDIYIVRHPETEGNINKIIYGKSHYPYTTEGKKQFNQIIESVKEMHLDKIYSSPLKRVKDLAEEISQIKGMAIHYDERIEEMGFGILEKHTYKEVDELYPEVYKNYLENYRTYKIPEGESFPEFKRRVLDFIQEVVKEECESILILSHGRVIKEILEFLLNLNSGQGWCFKIKNGCIIQIDYKKGYGQMMLK